MLKEIEGTLNVYGRRLEALNFPKLRTLNSWNNLPSGTRTLEHINFPSLEEVPSIYISALRSLRWVSFASLSSTSNIHIINCRNLESVSMPYLDHTTNGLNIYGNGKLKEISFVSLKEIENSGVNVYNNKKMKRLSGPARDLKAALWNRELDRRSTQRCKHRYRRSKQRCENIIAAALSAAKLLSPQHSTPQNYNRRNSQRCKLTITAANNAGELLSPRRSTLQNYDRRSLALQKYCRLQKLVSPQQTTLQNCYCRRT